MTTPDLFIIRVCPIGEAYRKQFSNFWTFTRLLEESRDDLAALAENITGAEYDHPIEQRASEIVLNRIKLCLDLPADAFKAAATNTKKGRQILQQLELKDAELSPGPLTAAAVGAD